MFQETDDVINNSVESNCCRKLDNSNKMNSEEVQEQYFEDEKNQFLLRILVHISLEDFSQSKIWNLCFVYLRRKDSENASVEMVK